MSKYVMARAYAHKGHTKMRREDGKEYEIASVSALVQHPELGRCYVGSWVEGIGAFNVHFPADAVRIALQSEVDLYLAGKFGSTFGLSYKAKAGDFATITDLDQLPVEDWKKYA